MNPTDLKGEHDQARAPESPAGTVSVGSSKDIAEGGRLVIDLPGDLTIGLFRLDGAFYAYENTCAHSGGPVCQGRILPRVLDVMGEGKTVNGQNWDKKDMHIVCPWHGFEYSIKTGIHAGDQTIKLRSFPVHESEGVVYVEL